MKDMKWDVLHSEYIIRRPWLTARRDKVRLPDGRVNDEYYVLEYPDWVNVIAITPDDRFVLVRQYRHGLGRTSFELCAGVCENGETPEESARRELFEETGYTGGEWHELMQLSANASTNTNITRCFVARGVTKTDTRSISTRQRTSRYTVWSAAAYTTCSAVASSCSRSWRLRCGVSSPSTADEPASPASPCTFRRSAHP